MSLPFISKEQEGLRNRILNDIVKKSDFNQNNESHFVALLEKLRDCTEDEIELLLLDFGDILDKNSFYPIEVFEQYEFHKFLIERIANIQIAKFLAKYCLESYHLIDIMSKYGFFDQLIYVFQNSQLNNDVISLINLIVDKNPNFMALIIENNISEKILDLASDNHHDTILHFSIIRYIQRFLKPCVNLEMARKILFILERYMNNSNYSADVYSCMRLLMISNPLIRYNLDESNIVSHAISSILTEDPYESQHILSFLSELYEDNQKSSLVFTKQFFDDLSIQFDRMDQIDCKDHIFLVSQIYINTPDVTRAFLSSKLYLVLWKFLHHIYFHVVARTVVLFTGVLIENNNNLRNSILSSEEYFEALIDLLKSDLEEEIIEAIEYLMILKDNGTLDEYQEYFQKDSFYEALTHIEESGITQMEHFAEVFLGFFVRGI